MSDLKQNPTIYGGSIKLKRKLSHPWRNDVIGNRCSNKDNRKKALAEVKRRAKLMAQ